MRKQLEEKNASNECKDEDPDLLIIDPPDPDSDPTCNNGFIKLLTSWTK